ncbi:MAG TPA: hypothetical protein RMH99_09330 [Sandaracinaceae bacterium LLY-WYZ-13_1]|nr:hypothetical protein [Sandaracinaceae bacterium LLY-WYZ-13_1]
MTRRRRWSLGCAPWLALAVAGCVDDATPADAGRDAEAGQDAGPPPRWPSELMASEGLGERRGRAVARSIVHLHSPLSHDACDGAGWVDGALADEACLAHFREAMCALRLDAVMLTDHAPHVEEVGFEAALWIEGGDEPVRDADGRVVASRLACPDGHRVLVTAGSENTLMPLALSRHPGDPGDPDALRALYDDDSPEAVAAFRDAGALIWQPHTEGRSLEALRATDLDGLELYTLHANVDPGIREEALGLDPAGFVPALLDFTRPALGLPPDLAVLAFLEPNRVALDRWDALLAEGRRVAATGGCDAHENALPMELADGERADSYRRMMFWIQNHLLVDERSFDGVREALDAGRLYVTSEVFGPPVGFDFVAGDADGVHEMGDEAALGAVLRVTRPRLPEGWPAEPPPAVSMHLLRATADGAVEVAAGDAIGSSTS